MGVAGRLARGWTDNIQALLCITWVTSILAAGYGVAYLQGFALLLVLVYEVSILI